MLAGPRDESPAAEPAPAPQPDDAPASPQEDPPVTAPAPVAEQGEQAVPVEPPASPPVEPPVDAACAAAVDQAREAAVLVAGPAVGDHLGAQVEEVPATGGHLVTHSFATTDPAYVGWRWAVTVARAQDSDVVTVDEVVLLPGGEALLAPAWVPWSERVQPGDLGPGDLLPPEQDDPRLVPSYADVDAERLPFDLHRELGLGRPRVLSRDGRLDAAERWYDGTQGPDTPLARQAPASCASCGFLAPMAGSLGRVFGVCANGAAPDDGRVVAVTHGCGAHSETVVEQPESSYAGMVVELEEIEMVDDEPGDAPAELAGGLADDAPPPAGDAGETGDAPAELAGGLADESDLAATAEGGPDEPEVF